MPRQTEEHHVTVAAAAEHLRISARTIYRLIETGQIGAVRSGRQWLIPAWELPGFERLTKEELEQRIKTTTEAMEGFAANAKVLKLEAEALLSKLPDLSRELANYKKRLEMME